MVVFRRSLRIVAKPTYPLDFCAMTEQHEALMNGDGTPALSLDHWMRLIDMSGSDDIERLYRSAWKNLDLSHNQIWAEYMAKARERLRRKFGITV